MLQPWTSTTPHAAARWRVALVAALAGLAGLAGCGPQAAPDASELPHTPLPKAEARLSLEVAGRALRYQGIVADTATRTALTTALTQAHRGRASGTISVDPNTEPARWAGNVAPLSQALARTGGIVHLHGRRIVLAGELSAEDRATLLRAAQRLYPGYAFEGAFRDTDLRQALPEPGDVDTLLALLNATPIVFHQGSGLLVPESLPVLARAARAIRAVGKVGRLQLRIYAERDDETARAIAAQRADALGTQFALRGIGPDRIQTVTMPAEPGHAGRVEFVHPAAAGSADTAGNAAPDGS